MSTTITSSGPGIYHATNWDGKEPHTANFEVTPGNVAVTIEGKTVHITDEMFNHIVNLVTARLEVVNGDLQNVVVDFIHYPTQIARIYRDKDSDPIGVNLWEIKGHARRADGFRHWKYQEVEAL